MFGLLKKKITSFIDNLTKKEEQKDEPEGEKEKQPLLGEPKAPATDAKPPQSSAPVPTPKPVQTEPIPPAAEKPMTPVIQPAPTILPPTAPTKLVETKTEPIATPTPTKTQILTTHIEPEVRKPTPAAAIQPAAIKSDEPKAVVQTPAVAEKPAEAPSYKPTSAVETTRQKPIEAAKPKTESVSSLTPAKSTPAPSKSSEKPAPYTPIPAMSRPDSKTSETTPKPATNEPAKERKLEAKLGILSQIKGLITREVQIQPSELEPMLEELNMALLESDVTLDTAEHIVATIKQQLSGKKVDKNRVQAEIQAAVKTALIDVLDKPPLDLIEFIRSHDKPVKILFLGPNGAGKTTTLAKITHYFKQNDLRCVLAAADTFRAAAIEQLQHHGAALQVPVIKHQYGADPAAVAFDAIAHAKAHGADVVLIDTAGRQETNYNLLKEMEKINRVVQPDLKLFIGEAVAGHALVEQAKAFHQTMKLDGVVLTKVDCDAKGGTSFSVSHEVGVPIVLLGTGQDYGDIRTFDAAWLVSNVLAE